MKILIIEDEQLLADSIAEVLRRKGFEAEAVYDGETGAEYAELGVAYPASRILSPAAKRFIKYLKVYVSEA